MTAPAPIVKSITPVITYDCGCGFRADTWKLAEVHARETAHTLTIHGRVIVEKPQDDTDRPTLVREKRREREA